MFSRVGDKESASSNLWLSRPSSFGNANVSVLMEEPMPINSVDVCADGVIVGSDSFMMTFIDKEFFV
ncbi:unnamed protein product [Toxocara canis]|uniref:Uncharacterized protein n=1 Tax=Toxocara canis TaxID=6265 RepID=A0A183VH96_TOXCA|nr:unnamed protein product [Toxocara canis]